MMMHILDRLTTILLRSEEEEEENIKIPNGFWLQSCNSYNTRCPFTGLTMQDPYSDDDGITYERKNIEAWLEDKDNPNHTISPVSGKTLEKKNLRKNRGVQDIIEEIPPDEQFKTELANDELIIFRYEFLLYSTYCAKLKSQIDAKISESIRNQVTHFHIQKAQKNWWPVINDRNFICYLIWTMFPKLRQKVYGEFIQIENPGLEYHALPPITNNTTKTLAEYYFVQAMKELFHKPKTEQIDKAIEMYRTHEKMQANSRIDSERKDRWNAIFGMTP